MRGPGNREGPSTEAAASLHPCRARREGHAPAGQAPAGHQQHRGSPGQRGPAVSDPKGRPWGLEWDPNFCGTVKAWDNSLVVSSGGYSHGTSGMPVSTIHTPMGLGTERF